MSDHRSECERFDRWLAEGGQAEDAAWREHLEACEGCRRQARTHQLLTAAFAEVPLPELSPGFDAGLERRIEASVAVRRLSGWRLAAMWFYVLVAGGLLSWALRDVPLPAVSLDSRWVSGLALAAVPLSMLLAAAASRLLPTRGEKRLLDSLRGLALCL